MNIGKVVKQGAKWVVLDGLGRTVYTTDERAFAEVFRDCFEATVVREMFRRAWSKSEGREVSWDEMAQVMGWADTHG